MVLKLLSGLAWVVPLAASLATPAQAADPAVAAALAPTGTLRVAINFGNPVLAQRDPAGGPPRGISADLARELARRLGLPLAYVTFEGAGLVTDAAKNGVYDVAFLAIDPGRATEISFTPPYVVIEGAYLVPQDSPIHGIDDVDQPGVRVMVDRGSAYDLFLRRSLTHATLVYPAPGARAATAYPAAPVEVLAGVRQPLTQFAATHAGYRMVPGRFMEIRQAMGALHGREKAMPYLTDFIEDMKASGFVAQALAASGQADAEVAPPGP